MDPLTQEINAPLGDTSKLLARIYNLAKASLEHHITLDPSVPADVGCAEAVSFILKNSSTPLFPIQGFAGTRDLYRWLAKSNSFESVVTPVAGCVVISPSGTSIIGSPHGHVGIVGLHGILSNDSSTGLFLEFWTIEKWQKYYQTKLGFPIFYYQAIN